MPQLAEYLIICRVLSFHILPFVQPYLFLPPNLWSRAIWRLAVSRCMRTLSGGTWKWAWHKSPPWRSAKAIIVITKLLSVIFPGSIIRHPPCNRGKNRGWLNFILGDILRPNWPLVRLINYFSLQAKGIHWVCVPHSSAVMATSGLPHTLCPAPGLHLLHAHPSGRRLPHRRSPYSHPHWFPGTVEGLAKKSL